LRDREARDLERRHVVDAVAHHRDVPALVSERLDDALLRLRGDPADDGRRAQESGELCGILGELAPVERLAGLDADVRGDRAAVSGRSPERTFSSTP
jgi:hypothetical protein